MNYNSIKFFLDKFITQVWGLSETDWVVTTIGSERDSNDNWTWMIYLKNSKTKEEKIIRIPIYKD